jgi:hypothetical protein
MLRPLRKLLLSVLVLALAFAALEAGLRVAGPSAESGNFTPVPKTIRRESTISGVKFMLAKNAEVVHEFGNDPRGYFDPGATLTYRTNSHGFRGPETTRAKPEGVFRIVGIGDSFTFGTGVRAEDTFLSVLQRRAGERAEVLNFGVMAYNTVAEVNLLRFEAVHFAPDVVVICFFLNDAGGAAQHDLFEAPREDEPQAPRPWWRAHVKSVDAILSGRERRAAGLAAVEDYRRSFRQGEKGWTNAKGALRHAKKAAEQYGFELVLAVFPLLYELSDYPLKDVHATIVEFGHKLGLHVVDLQPAFEDRDGPELWVHPANQHPNEIGHEIAGEALHAFLAAEGLLGP